MALKRNVAETLAKYTLRSRRGGGLVSQVTDIGRDMLEGTVYLFAIKGLIGISLPIFIIPVIVIVKKITEYGLGWLDEKVGFWKVEADYASRVINPFNGEMLKRIKHIEEIVQNDMDKIEGMDTGKR